MSSAFPEELDDFPASSALRQHTLGQDPHSVLHGNLGEAIEALETQLVWPLIYNVKGYGATGDGATDDTAAIQAAVTAAMASTGTINTVPPIIYLPAGTYKCGALTTITSTAGPTFVGAGMDATTIKMTATTWITLGTFSATPSSNYGAYQGLRLSDLMINGQEQATTEGSRTRRAVTDNGWGSLYFTNVVFYGMQYGVKANYGSDNNRIDNCGFQYCDVGVYLGAGSNQGTWIGGNFYHCREAFITDGVLHLGLYNVSFVDQAVVDFQAEFLATPRSGVTTQPGVGGTHTYYGYNEGSILLKGCYHESGAGSDNRKTTNGHICTTSDVSNSWPRGIHVENAMLAAGGSGGSGRSFWKYTSGQFCSLTDLTIIADQIAYAVDVSNGTHFRQERTRSVDGFVGPAVPWWNGKTSTCYGEAQGTALLTFTSGDTTPSVAAAISLASASTSGEVFKAASTSSVTITTFDDGTVGQVVRIVSTNGNTSFSNGTIKTRTGGTVTLGTNSTATFVYDGTNWFGLA